MTRQRKEIIKKMHELEEFRAVDKALGCGYTASDFGMPDPFDKAQNELTAKLAATYGMTVEEYFNMEMEIADRIFPVCF